MPKQESEREMSAANPKTKSGLKRAYQAPKLSIYGNLRQLTKGGSRSGNEGGTGSLKSKV